ncbi:MAG: type IX secretion system outer membrane channel protein PorV [Bacteroidia bacterium]|nr:type IX secretion system outer membrane channel protein PorV [Bacteroidia bacterium]NNF30640.1 type IX secretion system outer membrane channel protein PorV [Flavobacteriaceae bacterium]MBT8276307.1 type IX secretion system outer membrane channel protein PorV [Bacteroidia bacterium]NNJ80995.1 type IX secretion system outer membrane channel protein PorV [Flavobacteriaceae bacterium]NNK53200.1 type IX secretion system outer membrane channel protein PorV [Flavobacteriaceae bacterium]
MKKFFIPIFICLFTFKAVAQDNSTANQRVITTAVPFILIAADARAAGMGDIGVATSADAFSQQWNPAKYAFAISKQGVGITYTPYLSQLVNDIFLGNLTYYNRINERSSIAASLRYFSLGDIELRQTIEQDPLIQSPNEFTFDVSYALRLSERFSMAVAGRYLRSDLRIQASTEDASAASSFAVDIAGFYQSEEIAYDSFDGRWRAGFNISNIGPKIKYDEVGQENNLPTNLALGGGFDFILDAYNKIGINAEVNKLLVPTPQDFDGDGDIDAEDDEEYESISFFSGIFKSFGDAPDGFSEELKEFTWALGAEYWYQDVFAFRTGYFNESDLKGSRKFLSLGAGFRYTAINIDISYLFSTSKVRSPLEGTLRFGLTFNFGDEYDEY